jgi:hypothetical protein
VIWGAMRHCRTRRLFCVPKRGAGACCWFAHCLFDSPNSTRVTVEGCGRNWQPGRASCAAALPLFLLCCVSFCALCEARLGHLSAAHSCVLVMRVRGTHPFFLGSEFVAPPACSWVGAQPLVSRECQDDSVCGLWPLCEHPHRNVHRCSLPPWAGQPGGQPGRNGRKGPAPSRNTQNEPLTVLDDNHQPFPKHPKEGVRNMSERIEQERGCAQQSCNVPGQVV